MAGKRMKSLREKVEQGKTYAVGDAVIEGLRLGQFRGIR